MGRRKITPFQAWESKADNGVEKRYIRLGVTQMSTDVMKQLTPAALKIYIYMKLESGGKIQYTFPHNRYASYMSKPTFFRVIRELETCGFIDVVKRNKNLRQSNVYRFSDRWKQL